MLNNKVILITGGTGSFGNKYTNYIFKNFKPKKVIIFSRDEFKQFEMAKMFPENKFPIRFFLGDIRDKERLLRTKQRKSICFRSSKEKQKDVICLKITHKMQNN